MKKVMKGLFATVMATTVFSSAIALAADSDFGAAGALADNEYELQEMLEYAIEDEFLAEAEYNAIMEEYGVQRPFSNIVTAEAKHVDMLLPLFEAYKVAVPENNSDEKVVLPASLEEIYSAGVEAEKNNISMYTEFLKEDIPEDVREVFEYLRKASENHLKAFENAAERNSEGYMGLGKTGDSLRNGNAGEQGRLRAKSNSQNSELGQSLGQGQGTREGRAIRARQNDGSCIIEDSQQ